MHIPDGFIDLGTSAGAGLVAAGGLGVATKRAGAQLDERAVPLAGLVAAFTFAMQMVSFPVAAGTSGHLLGGVLAAVLVGPWLGAVCASVVLAVQALLFADGGLSALGLNLVNMALVGGLLGYALFAGLRAVLPKTAPAVVLAAGLAAGASVVLSSLAFCVEYAVGGTGGASVGAVVAAMAGVHLLIGIGEGVITAMIVSSVLAVRPDLVWGARHLQTVPPVLAAGAEAA
ncbi:MAG: energy-coupling factor ABC transporter permease [Acidimicrobiales bacterium]